MQVLFAGSGDAFGSGGRLQACLLIRGEGMSLLLDCGTTTLVGLRRLGVDPAEVDAVVVSHLHGDHFGGLPFLILDAQFSRVRRTRPLTIAGPPGVAERVTAAMEVLFPGSTAVERRFETRFVELDPGGPAVDVAGAQVSAVAVVHDSGATPLALRVEVGTSVVAYSGDTEWTDALLDVSRDADLFVCEAYTFRKRVRFHLDFGTLRANLPRVTARQVVLTHMSEDMLRALPFADLDDHVSAAYDGLVVTTDQPADTVPASQHPAR